jgi:hypothetical protein
MKNSIFYLILISFFFCLLENNLKAQINIVRADIDTSINYYENLDSNYTLFNSKKAILSKIFDGEYDSTECKIIWNASKLQKIKLSDDGLCHTNIDDILYFQKGKNKFAVVILRTVEYFGGIVNSCAGCSPNIGIALFQQSNLDWALIKSNPNICDLGQGGEVPEKTIVQIGKNDLALSLSGSELAGGAPIAREYEYLYFLDENKFGDLVFNYNKAKLLNIKSNLVQESQMEFIKSDKKRYYDIKIISKQYDYNKEPKKLIKVLPENIKKIQ